MGEFRRITLGLGMFALLGLLAGCMSRPVAIVNGQRITQKELYERLQQVAGERVLADLIARQLLTDAFNRSGLQVTEQEVTAEIEKMKKQAPSEQDWLAYLQQQGMTEADLREQVAFSLKVKKLAEKDVKVSEEALRKHFAENRERFDRPETVRLSEIVVTDKGQAEKIRAQLAKDAAQFATLARQYSISTYTRERGGLRPEEPLVSLQPEAVRRVVQRMRVGEISQPIQAEGVWYIVKLEQRNPAQKAEYEKVKDQVREHYLATHAKSVQAMLEEYRKTARVRIMDPRYAELARFFGPPPSLPTFGAQGGSKAPATGQPTAPSQGQSATPGAAQPTSGPAPSGASQAPAGQPGAGTK